MKQKTLFLIGLCVQHYCYTVVTIKSPIATTVPLRAKVYGIHNTQTYHLQQSEKPLLFKPFDNSVNDYSWKYISKIKPNEFGYVLVGYDEKNQAAARESGAAISDPSRIQLPEPPTQTTSNQASPANANINTSNTIIKNEIAVAQQQEKHLLLELNVMCTNISGVPLRKKQVENAIAGGKIYGTSFDLKNNKQCYIVAKKYKDDAPAPEMQECIEKIYGGVLGVGGALEQ